MITVGMDYVVQEGKGKSFEQLFKKVLTEMNSFPGHKVTKLLQDCEDKDAYTIMSEWTSEDEFNAFIGSDRFKKVTQWGFEVGLKNKPKHEIYRTENQKETKQTPPPQGDKCPFH
jgi:heme-degrading monooxygenase HmoA